MRNGVTETRRFSTAWKSVPGPASEAVYLIAEGQGRRWCASVHAAPIGEAAIAEFDAFCRVQSPRPSRKVIVGKAGLEENARLLAKAANMWVWEGQDLHALMGLYEPA